MRLSLRLALIAGVALALVISVLVISFIVIQRPARLYGVVLPLPKQAAAMVDLAEHLPAEQWPVAERALSTPSTKVRILAAEPGTTGGRPMPGVALALQAYLAAMGGRSVSVMAELDEPQQSPDIEMGPGQVRATRPVRILIGLHNGKILMIEARGPASARYSGVRMGLLALLVSIVIGVISLWVITRQFRPLERLAAAVDKFGARLETSRLEEEGTVELRQLIAAFNRLQDNIGALVKGRTRIISAVGHDVGTYLTRLRLRAEYIADETQRARAISDIDDMHRLMSETLALAKLEHDGEGPAPLDIVPILRKLVAAHTELGEPVRLVALPGPLLVHMAPAGFERVAENLISNAVKYGREALLRTVSGPGVVHLLVEDRGPGIPEAERLAVLEPFYRRDAARNLNERGFGLGLAITDEVVRSAGGTLVFEDREGGGLRVRVTLPVVDALVTSG